MKPMGFKKCFTVFLATLLTLGALPAVPVTAATTHAGKGNGAKEIARAYDSTHLFATNQVTKAGLPVTVKSYADKTKYAELGAKTPMPFTSNSRKYETVVYSIGHHVERIGQDTDVDIIGDFLAEGYIVLVLDFGYHKDAVAGKLENAIYEIKIEARKQSGNPYLKNLTSNRPTMRSYWIFSMLAGYRMERNVVYYDLLKNGPEGTADQILKAWNDDSRSSSFKNSKASKIPACEWNNNKKGVWYEATHVEQLVRPDPVTKEAIPLDYELALHIIYPANPTRETPVYMAASSWEDREGGGSGNRWNDGLMARGYTYVVYDHEYYPMAREDHYAYFIGDYGYGMMNYIGVQTHSAAVRCVRSLAHVYGYSDYEGYSVSGASKASYCSVLGSDEPNERAEWKSFQGPFTCLTASDGFVYGSEGLPNLTYPAGSPKAGQPISARVQGVVSSVGDGLSRHASIVTDDTSPTVMGVGKSDPYGAWDYWEACQATYMEHDVINLAVGMLELAHDVPHGIDTVYNYDRAQATIDFLEYNANVYDVPVKLIYSWPVANDASFKGEEPILLHFTGPVPETEIADHARVIDVTTGEELSGTWTPCAGDAKYSFVSNTPFVYDHNYKIILDAELKGDNGLAMGSAKEIAFHSTADPALPAIADAMIVDGNGIPQGTGKTLTLTGPDRAAYLTFDLSSMKEPIAGLRLAVQVENDAFNAISIYAVEGDFDEATLTYQNAPKQGKLLGTLNITGPGLYKLDVSDLISATMSTRVTLMLVNEVGSSSDFGYDKTWDDGVFRKTSATAQCFSDKAEFRTGGAPRAVALSTEQNHTPGGSHAIKLTRANTYDRIKLYNTVKTSALTEADLGATYKATAWVYSPEAMTMTMGTMSASGDKYGTSFCGTTQDTAIPAGQWTECTLTFVLGEAHIGEQAGLLTFQGTGTGVVYIDDVKVERLATEVVITSREGAEANAQLSAPALLASTADGPIKVGSQYYDSLIDAFEAVPSDNRETKITLLADVASVGTLTVSEKQSIVLDLGGHTVTTDFSASNAFVVNGRLTLKNGTLKDPRRDIEKWRYTFRVKGANATLIFEEGLVVDTLADCGVAQLGGDDNDTKINGTLIIREGVTVFTIWNVAYAYGGGALTIEGGTFYNDMYDILFTLRAAKNGYSAPRTVSGGAFTVNPDGHLDKARELFSTFNGLTVTGGTFSEAIQAEIIGDGFKQVDNGNGTFSVISTLPPKETEPDTSKEPEVIPPTPEEKAPVLLASSGMITDTTLALVAGINSLAYDEVGFEVTRTVDGKSFTCHNNRVFTKLTLEDTVYAAEEAGHSYLYALLLTGLDAASGDITVTPVAYINGERIPGLAATYRITVQNGKAAILPLK